MGDQSKVSRPRGWTCPVESHPAIDMNVYICTSVSHIVHSTVVMVTQANLAGSFDVGLSKPVRVHGLQVGKNLTLQTEQSEQWPYARTVQHIHTSTAEIASNFFFYKILETGWRYYGHCCYRQQAFHPWYSHYDDCNDICLGNSKITTGNLLTVCIPSIQCTCLSLLLIFNLLQRLHDTRRHQCQRSASPVGPGALEWHTPAWSHGNVESSQTQSNMYTQHCEKVSDAVVLLQSAK